MATKSNQPTFYALGVDEFGPGFADDFDGTIKVGSPRYLAYKYPNSQYGHNLFAEFVVVPDADSGFDEFTVKYKAGSLKQNYPSPDGRSLAGPDDISVDDYEQLADDPEAFIEEGQEDLYSGPFAVTTRKEGKLPPSDWQQFMDSVKKCYPPDDPENDPDGTSFETKPNIDEMLSGYRFHFLRMAQDSSRQRKKSGDDKKGGREFLILCATEALGKEETVKGKKSDKSSNVKDSTKAKPKSKPVVEEEEDDELEGIEEETEETEVEEEETDDTTDDGDDDDDNEANYTKIIKSIIAASKDGITRQRLSAESLNKVKTASEKSELVKLIGNVKWMQDKARPWRVKDGKYVAK